MQRIYIVVKDEQDDFVQPRSGPRLPNHYKLGLRRANLIYEYNIEYSFCNEG